MLLVDFFPVVQHQVFTEDSGLQEAAEKDMAMFFDYKLKRIPTGETMVDAALPVESAPFVDQGPLAEAVTVGSFLQGLGLGSFQAAFEANDIELDMIPEMEASDFKALGLSIGQRVRLQRAYTELALQGPLIPNDVVLDEPQYSPII